MGVLRKSLTANLAVVRFFPRVRKPVNAKRTRLRKCLIAYRAFIRFLSGMDAKMRLQSDFCKKPFSAITTKKSSFAVRQLVRLQGVFSGESASTGRTFVTFQRRTFKSLGEGLRVDCFFAVCVGGVASHVSLVLVGLFEGCSAVAAYIGFLACMRAEVLFQRHGLNETCINTKKGMRKLLLPISR